MIKVLFGACMVSLLAFSISACSDDQPEYDNSIVTSDTTIMPSASTKASDIGNKASTNIINFDTAKSLNTSPIIQVPTQTFSTKSTVALNPAHGKPGHRCEIAVGAPLNSSPNTPVQQVQSTPPTLVQSSPVQQIQSTPPTLVQSSPAKLPVPAAGSGRLNPPHGEPGHTCDIAVGQPLK